MTVCNCAQLNVIWFLVGVLSTMSVLFLGLLVKATLDYYQSLQRIGIETRANPRFHYNYDVEEEVKEEPNPL